MRDKSHNQGNAAYIGIHQCKCNDCPDYKVQLEWCCKTRPIIWKISMSNFTFAYIQLSCPRWNTIGRCLVYLTCLLNYIMFQKGGWSEEDPMTIGTIWHISGQRVSIINADGIVCQVCNLAVCCQYPTVTTC